MQIVFHHKHYRLVHNYMISSVCALNTICPVCFEVHDEEEPNELCFVTMSCGHSICEACYNEWHIMKRNPHCVLCRRRVWIPPVMREPIRSSPRPLCSVCWSFWSGHRRLFKLCGICLCITGLFMSLQLAEPIYSILIVGCSITLVVFCILLF